MANQPIHALPLAERITDYDLFVLEQDGIARKLTGATLTDFIDRQVMDITVHDLSATSTPTAQYDRITGKLELGIPKGNSIVSITLSKEGRVVYTWADGSSVEMETIKGDTGKSAYQYAVEQGYQGSETDFATLQINLYNASLNEDERVKAEEKRKQDYTYMMNKLNDKLANMEQLENRLDCQITGTTLVLNAIGISVVDTTLMM